VYTPRLLRVLETHGAKATFFLIGERAEEYPEIVEGIAAAGHAIGNHTYSHRALPDLTRIEQSREIARCREAIGGLGTSLFRPPYGQQSELSFRSARRAGYEVVGWSVLSGDWKLQPSRELAANILAQIEPGAIVLMHDALHEPRDACAANRDYAIEAVDQVLARLGSHTRFVTVPELYSLGKKVRRAWFTRRRPYRNEKAAEAPPFKDTTSIIEGRLRMGLFEEGRRIEAEEYSTEWVRGTDYSGMQDCDIRGFLDGGFRWAWNQPGQVHVRVGRLGWIRREDRPPELGERELFRCLQRWDELELPSATEVLEASLTLDVEVGAPQPADVCLYEVFTDWEPGEGGVERNNVSVPAPGEVWWNEPRAGSRYWSKPGASQAGDPQSPADTGTTPLASCRYEPGDGEINFTAPELSAYVQRRVRDAEPLLFLIKLSDVDEDRDGSVLTLWSAEHGDDRNPATRPRLRLRWRSRAQTAALEIDVRLEQGRSLDLSTPEWPAGGILALEWTPAGQGVTPEVQVRASAADGEWSRCRATGTRYESGLELRLLAARNPVYLGADFRTGLEDTWVTSGPPENQVVEWSFVSPSGMIHRRTSTYTGGYRWDVSVRANEIGSWRYYWTHELSGRPVRGPVGRFDVVADDLGEVHAQMEELVRDIEIEGASTGPAILRSWEQRLMSLERAAVALTPSETWRQDGGQSIRDAVGRVRSALLGQTVSPDLPMVSHDLIREVDGRPLFDPYPAYSHQSPGRRRHVRRVARRLRRRLARLMR
jgi:hypothetical protein